MWLEGLGRLLWESEVLGLLKSVGVFSILAKCYQLFHLDFSANISVPVSMIDHFQNLAATGHRDCST
jgi:hypothetical protein